MDIETYHKRCGELKELINKLYDSRDMDVVVNMLYDTVYLLDDEDYDILMTEYNKE